MSGLEKTFAAFLTLLGLAVAGVVGSLLFFLTPAQLWQALANPETIFALRFTLVTSALATLIALVLGIPAAYFLARRSFPGHKALDTFLDLPLVMPPLVAGVGLLLFWGQSQVAGAMARMGLALVFSPAGVVVAQAFVASFIVLRGAKAAFQAVDPRYEAAGLTLGMGPLLVFTRITLPLAGRGLLSTAVLAWARAMGEFGATLMLAGATRLRTETMPVAVYLNLSSGEPHLAVACALLLLFLGFILLGFLRWLTARAPGNGQPEENGVAGH